MSRQLASPQRVYAGFDPSAESLHVGNLIPLLGLRRFQAHGHGPIALIGGATGLVGDPSGKSQERDFVDRELVQARAAAIGDQLRALLPEPEDGPAVTVVNNIDWFEGRGLLEFLRDIGKKFSLQSMLAKSSIRDRLANPDQGISYAEFSYMLIQATDFVELARRHDCKVQIGGADQWGNMTAGLDLAGRFGFADLHVLTHPLVTLSDGRKFGKTEEGTVWLSAELTSEWDFFQFWFNTPDQDVVRFLKWFTFLDAEEIARCERETAESPAARAAQRRLAMEMTTLVHGREVADRISAAAVALFGGANDLAAVSESTIEQIMRSSPSLVVSGEATVVEAMVDSGLAKSRSDARRLAQQGALKLNGQPLADVDAPIAQAPGLLHGHYAVLRRGRRHYAIVKTA